MVWAILFCHQILEMSVIILANVENSFEKVSVSAPNQQNLIDLKKVLFFNFNL